VCDWYGYPCLTKISIVIYIPRMNTFVWYCQHRFQVQPSWPALKSREGHPVKRTARFFFKIHSFNVLALALMRNKYLQQQLVYDFNSFSSIIYNSTSLCSTIYWQFFPFRNSNGKVGWQKSEAIRMVPGPLND
jgi:hypothetical protein